jgi:hypothetical protein
LSPDPRPLSPCTRPSAAIRQSGAVVQCCSAQPTSAFSDRAHFMEQNGGSFCHLAIAFSATIPEWTRTASAQYASIESRIRVFGAKRQLPIALYQQDLRRIATQQAPTKPQKTSSENGFCHSVATSPQTKCGAGIRPSTTCSRSSERQLDHSTIVAPTLRRGDRPHLSHAWRDVAVKASVCGQLVSTTFLRHDDCILFSRPAWMKPSERCF